MKKAFGILYTLAFIIILAVVSVVVLKFNGYSNVHVTRSFVDTRAELTLKSATEYAVMALDGHDFRNGLLEHVNMSNNMFDINITYHYFLTDCQSGDLRCSKIETADTNGSVLIYVTVTSKNPFFYVRKVRYTLQNP